MENGKDPEKIKGNLGFCRVEGVQDLWFGFFLPSVYWDHKV